ncbi:Peptidase M50B-like [Haloechinothrix alba]|uniref:Peptidase M50B-like n=1 Tax=Haloechinothrix alba TaxID=664784 RepID=A0A238VKF0_9PSEU|nr:Peptidase M50B-like [Haloechinothrix alba]
MPSEAEQWWERVFGTAPEPHIVVPLVTVTVALILVLSGGLWRLFRRVVTMVHEAGHALVAVLAGRRLQGIRLHSDTSGVTVSRGRATGTGMVLTTLAGYPAPALLGLLFGALVITDLVVVVLGLSALLTLGVLVMVRNLYGVFTVLAVAAVLGGVAFYAGPEIQASFVYLITWFLLLGSVRPILEMQAKRRRGAARDSDADQLARLTGVPAALWVVVLLAFAAVCVAMGGYLMLEPAVSAIDAGS